jgi:hypothetical protein
MITAPQTSEKLLGKLQAENKLMRRKENRMRIVLHNLASIFQPKLLVDRELDLIS